MMMKPIPIWKIYIIVKFNLSVLFLWHLFSPFGLPLSSVRTQSWLSWLYLWLLSRPRESWPFPPGPAGQCPDSAGSNPPPPLPCWPEISRYDRDWQVPVLGVHLQLQLAGPVAAHLSPRRQSLETSGRVPHSPDDLLWAGIETSREVQGGSLALYQVRHQDGGGGQVQQVDVGLDVLREDVVPNPVLADQWLSVVLRIRERESYFPARDEGIRTFLAGWKRTESISRLSSYSSTSASPKLRRNISVVVLWERNITNLGMISCPILQVKTPPGTKSVTPHLTISGLPGILIKLLIMKTTDQTTQ